MARLQTIWADKLRPGDIYVTGPDGSGAIRRTVVRVSRPNTERIHVVCEDGSTPILSPNRLIKVERGRRR